MSGLYLKIKSLVHRHLSMGTRSVLFGAHCFFIHPWFVAWGWTRLYGFPWDPRLWVAFIVHDLGYWGKPNMDGEEGEQHPYLGAKIMGLFGKEWYEFTLYHSRFLAKRNHAQFSRLCPADKMAMILEPSWLYLPRVAFTGELEEFMYNNPREVTGHNKTPEEWFSGVKSFMLNWVNLHKDGGPDTVTKGGNSGIV